MKTTIKTGIAALMLLSAISCTKSINSPSSSFAQASNNDDQTAAFTIGQSYHGGIIFYIDGTGQHGLIAATTDQGTGNTWKKGPNVLTGASATAVGTGLSNTNKIVAAHGNSGTYAALLCANYVSGTYVDWYLPSKDELNLMYQQKAVLGISTGDYWSSLEVSLGKAWEQEFGGGFQFKDKKTFTLHVRAIESF